MWENTTPSTELPRDFCAGIGPLQLGVVLVTLLFVVVFCRAQTIFSIFNQVSSSVCKEQSPGAYDSVYQKRTWRIRFNLSWAPLVPMDPYIKGAQAYMIQFNMTLSMDPVAIHGSYS